MRLTFLGTGSAMPTGHRFQSGTLLASGEDVVLLDCGSGVLHALARTDPGYEGVDAVLLTHHHLDHVADLLPLFKARWLAGATELTVAGPPGTTALVEDLLSVHDYMQDRMELTLRDVDMEFQLAGFDVTAMETRHSMQCFAYRLTPTGEGVEEGAISDPPTVATSGDSEAFEELAAFADGATVFVHDCSFPDDVDVSNHPTPESLGAALSAADPDVDRIYLTHLYPHTDGHHEAMLDSIASVYDGDVRFAEDGLTLQLGPKRTE
jgi:ribonuclease BN (tRNA processing enzyme)